MQKGRANFHTCKYEKLNMRAVFAVNCSQEVKKVSRTRATSSEMRKWPIADARQRPPLKAWPRNEALRDNASSSAFGRSKQRSQAMANALSSRVSCMRLLGLPYGVITTSWAGQRINTIIKLDGIHRDCFVGQKLKFSSKLPLPVACRYCGAHWANWSVRSVAVKAVASLLVLN